MSNQMSSASDIYADISSAKLVEIYSLGPDRVESVIDGLSLEEMKMKPILNKWSVSEIVHHLADSEMMGALRIRQLAAEDNPQFACYNQDLFASNFSYNNRDEAQLKMSMSLFRLVRETTTKILNYVSENHWTKIGNHPEVGDMTFRQLLEDYADHSERHIDQILTLRGKLGKPLIMELLLKDRL